MFGFTLRELVRLVLVFRQHDVSLAFLDGDVVAQSDWHFQTAIMFLHARCSDEIASRPLVAMLFNQFQRILGNFRWGLRQKVLARLNLVVIAVQLHVVTIQHFLMRLRNQMSL
jgi:hypothetical protein